MSTTQQPLTHKIDEDDVYAELEQERLWREEEFTLLTNQTGNIKTPEKQDTYRKSLILMLYASFEGNIKSSLQIYVNRLNSTNIPTHAANEAIAAASLEKIFKALRNPDRKCSVFRRKLPDDTKLHKFARDREFYSDFSKLIANTQKNIKLDADTIVDMESNLKPVVLRKILYKLGLDISNVDQWSKNLDKFLGYRNAIAHGQRKKGISEHEFNNLHKLVREITTQVNQMIMTAIREQSYLKPEE